MKKIDLTLSQLDKLNTLSREQCIEYKFSYPPQKGWKKIYTRSMRWHSVKPFDENIFEKFEWPKFSDSEIYKFAFEDKIIDNLNHEQVRVARGQKNES